MDIGTALDTAIEHRPDAPAIRTPERTYTYRELGDAVRSTGSGIVERTGNGDRVALATADTVEAIITCLGAWYTGRTVVHIPPHADADDVQRTVEHTAPALLVADTDFLDTVEGVRDVPGTELAHIDTVFDAFRGADGVEREHTELASITYTSGTTGTPKPVPFTHERMLDGALSFVIPMQDIRDAEPSCPDERRARRAGETARTAPVPEAARTAFIADGVWRDDRYFDFFPISHAAGAATTLFAFLAGATLLLPGSDDPSVVAGMLDRDDATILGGLPHQLQQLYAAARERPADLSSIDIVHTGGSWSAEGFMEETQAVADAHIYSSYASSETMQIAYAVDTTAIGEPTFLHDVRLVRPGASPEDGEVDRGEILVNTAGPTVFDGYWNAPEATAENITDGWFRTGDIARRDDAGVLWFEGRASNLIDVDGELVAPERIERILLTHPAVTAAGVVGVEAGAGETRLVAFIEADADIRDELDAYIGERADTVLPDEYRLTPDIPRLPTSGVDRAALAERYRQ